MIPYILDANFQRVDVIDVYSSLIWTERYNESGECVFVYPKNSHTNSIIQENSYIGLEGSPEIMVIQTVQTKEGAVTAQGKTLIEFFKQRIFRNDYSGRVSNWDLVYASAAAACSDIVYQMCVAGGMMSLGNITPNDGASEVIPGLDPNGMQAAGTAFYASVPYGDLYSAIKAICDADGIGFNLLPVNIMSSSGDTKFNTYRGLDRTSSQNINSLVVFEDNMDSLAEIEEVRSIENYKNVAYAWASNMTDKAKIGYAAVPGPIPSGYNRRTLMIDAGDINAEDYVSGGDLKGVLDRRAADGLINNNYIRTTDGKIIPQNPYRYGEAYSIGDIIELRNSTSYPQKARVAEYIRSEDENGETAYPTLSLIS